MAYGNVLFPFISQHQYEKPLQLGIFLLLSFNTVSDFDTNIFTPNDYIFALLWLMVNPIDTLYLSSQSVAKLKP